jgi:hypothetical protein
VALDKAIGSGWAALENRSREAAAQPCVVRGKSCNKAGSEHVSPRTPALQGWEVSGTFVSDAAQEINTPLSAFKTNLELARNEPNPSKEKSSFAALSNKMNALSILQTNCSICRVWKPRNLFEILNPLIYIISLPI